MAPVILPVPESDEVSEEQLKGLFRGVNPLDDTPTLGVTKGVLDPAIPGVNTGVIVDVLEGVDDELPALLDSVRGESDFFVGTCIHGCFRRVAALGRSI